MKENINKTYLYEVTLHDQYKNRQLWSERENDIQIEHISYLEKLANERRIEIACMAEKEMENQTSIIILSFMTYDRAKEILMNDPSVKYGMVSANLRPIDVYLKQASYF